MLTDIYLGRPAFCAGIGVQAIIDARLPVSYDYPRLCRLFYLSRPGAKGLQPR